MWPGRRGHFIRQRPATDADRGMPPGFEIAAGCWGHLSVPTGRYKIAEVKELSTVNFRDDQVHRSLTFSNAWKRSQHCIMPATAIFEPDYRGLDGQPVITSSEARISCIDGGMLGLAGLWDSWTDEDGAPQLIFTVLTVNANDHPLMRNYQRSNVEKRMLVMLPCGLYRAWLHAPAHCSMDFLRQFPADQLQGVMSEHEVT